MLFLSGTDFHSLNSAPPQTRALDSSQYQDLWRKSRIFLPTVLIRERRGKFGVRQGEMLILL